MDATREYDQWYASYRATSLGFDRLIPGHPLRTDWLLNAISADWFASRDIWISFAGTQFCLGAAPYPISADTIPKAKKDYTRLADEAYSWPGRERIKASRYDHVKKANVSTSAFLLLIHQKKSV